MRRGARLLPLVLAALLLLPLSACAKTKGSIAEYDGFTVRTERTRGTGDAPMESIGLLRSSDDAAQEDYVLNVSSHKFHYPWCGAVGEIKEKNRWEYRGTRDSVLDMGYEPCKSCNP